MLNAFVSLKDIVATYLLNENNLYDVEADFFSVHESNVC